MPKTKTVAADELIFLFREELGPLIDGPAIPSVAIVPDQVHGWTALISHKDRKWHPELAGHVARIEKSLRRRFALAREE
ncbi:hypothetical protein [Rhodopseudomonas sp. RCAM05734]|uniref:hypothetical protein n=1 Tax=Rhodopseudomonas sp. RCAM05734 TaxID=3457549 RepID=UPI004043F176